MNLREVVGVPGRIGHMRGHGKVTNNNLLVAKDFQNGIIQR